MGIGRAKTTHLSQCVQLAHLPWVHNQTSEITADPCDLATQPITFERTECFAPIGQWDAYHVQVVRAKLSADIRSILALVTLFLSPCVVLVLPALQITHTIRSLEGKLAQNPPKYSHAPILLLWWFGYKNSSNSKCSHLCHEESLLQLSQLNISETNLALRSVCGDTLIIMMKMKAMEMRMLMQVDRKYIFLYIQ